MNRQLTILTVLTLLGLFIAIYFSSQEVPEVITVEAENPDKRELSEDNPSEIPSSAYSYRVTKESQVSYSILKKFFNKPEEPVVGVSNDIEGEGWFDTDAQNAFVQIKIDAGSLKTDNSTRDSHVLDMLSDPNIYLLASLEDTDIRLNEEFNLDIPVTLTLNNATQEVIFKIVGVVKENEIVASGSSTVKLTDFGIDPPSLANVFTADDNLELRFDIKADRIY